MGLFYDLPAVNARRIAERDIAVMKLILDAWGYPPDGDVYDLLRAFVTERIGGKGHNDANSYSAERAASWMRSLTARNAGQKLDGVA